VFFQKGKIPLREEGIIYSGGRKMPRTGRMEKGRCRRMERPALGRVFPPKRRKNFPLIKGKKE